MDLANERVEFIPVEWRSSLKLDSGVVNMITPVHVRVLRNLLNSSFMDIMYHTSPLYHNEIISYLAKELNRLYQLFVQLNPNFESNGGKVSILGHSLGSVLAYDLITNSCHSLHPETNQWTKVRFKLFDFFKYLVYLFFFEFTYMYMDNGLDKNLNYNSD